MDEGHKEVKQYQKITKWPKNMQRCVSLFIIKVRKLRQTLHLSLRRAWRKELDNPLSCKGQAKRLIPLGGEGANFGESNWAISPRNF